MPLYRNQSLFSDYYLQKLLPETDFWKKIKKDKLKRIFDEIKTIYQKQKSTIPDLNESQLEDSFIRPVLRRLDHIYDVNVSLPKVYEGLKRPDYVFYASDKKKRLGVKEAIAIGEAKRFGRHLDRKLPTEKEPFEVQNPCLQMSRYLWISEAPWGILTDGKFWRLFERETSKRLDIFYEIDLFELIEQGTLEDFKYFYLFFRRESFPEFLKRVYDESIEYSRAVGKELKESVYKALKVLAEGFLKTPTNNLSPIKLKEIHENCHVFLYRLLFIFYAEARRLLPLDEQIYKDTYSLHSLKNEVKEKVDKWEAVSPILFVYWDKLKTLFDLVNKGSEVFGIFKDDMYIPPYNGGLFDPEKHRFLEDYKVADKWLTRVIDLLARSPSQKGQGAKAFVDYSSLDIRHLGSIYEGLLEYKLKIAETDMVAVKEKGKEVWKPKGQKDQKIVEEVPEGDIYCITDKGERKTTGSYYTPGYIVEYIVENTLGPIIKRIHKEAELVEEIKQKTRPLNDIFEDIVKQKEEKELKNIQRLWQLTRNNKERQDFLLNILSDTPSPYSYNPIDRILQLKVLDPAMGSGHFLVEVTDYLASALVEVLGEYPKEISEEEKRWARREVVERCVYGVDLNPLAVELAKLSLWLSTVAKDKPLSFLDHHLRCGNSLIGSKAKDLARLPQISKKKKELDKMPVQLEVFGEVLKQRLPVVLGDIMKMLKEPSDRVEQIRKKENLYTEILDILTPFKEVADVWTSIYFGNEKIGYDWMLTSLRSSDKWSEVKEKEWFKKAQEINEKKHFFHWELEFPEIFFDEYGREKNNPGFDVVLGNPPYDAELDHFDSKWMNVNVNYSKNGRLDTASLFTEYFIPILKSEGLLAYLLPHRLIGRQRDFGSFQKYIFENGLLKEIIYLGTVPEFESNDEFIISTFANNYFEDFIIGHNIPLQEFPNIDKFKQSIRRKLWGPPNYAFNIYLNEFSQAILEKVVNLSFPLSAIAESKDGIVVFIREKLLSDKQKDERYKKLLGVSGRYSLERYTLEWIPTYICYDINEAKKYIPDTKELRKVQLRDESIFLKKEKIITAQDSIFLKGTIDSEQFFHTNSIHSTFLTRDSSYSLKYLVSLINHPLMSYFYQTLRLKGTDLHPQILVTNVPRLPIRRISFTTSPDKRKKLFEEEKELFRNYLKTKNLDSILFFVQQRLSVMPEQSDVVHDLLEFLAEKMIEYNKSKDKEIKSFLKWLEGGIGAEVENLSNKTTIKKYYENDIDKLLDILKKNKRRLKIDPARRDFQTKMETEFNKSIEILNPLREKISRTDNLIDKIIYKLYRLTKEEIKVVEKHFSARKK